MKTKITKIMLTALILLGTFNSKAQMTAMDFTMVDCNSSGTHNLFSDLNSGKVVIIEYFMISCGSCIVAGQALESMKSNLLSQYPGKVKSYAFGFNNTYSCSAIVNWVNTNGFTSIPSDSGAVQVAYYGGMGMPTIIIAAGTNHQLLGSPYVGFNNSDTTQMATNIRTFLNSQVSIKENTQSIKNLSVYPNPANGQINVSFSLLKNSEVTMELIDITGRKIANLVSEKMSAGIISKTFNTSSFQEGNYFLKINSSGIISQQKISIIH
jgi:hypothetical protein